MKLKRWSWGAFGFNALWGIAHKCYWPLLCCIPFFGVLWMFVCGFKGNEWAYERGEYDSIQDFENKEFGWEVAGIVMTILTLIFFIGEISILLGPEPFVRWN